MSRDSGEPHTHLPIRKKAVPGKLPSSEVERAWRKKEREAAMARARKAEELRIVREKQILDRRKCQAIEIQREKEEMERIARVHREELEKQILKEQRRLCGERAWRKKEREAAMARARKAEELRIAREKQILDRRKCQAIEIQREKEEVERIARVHREELEKQKLEEQRRLCEKLKEKVKRQSLNLQGILECPVCLNTMDSTLKQCINGHGVCSSCVRKVNQCPTCLQELSSVRQNTLLGYVLENIPKPCPYTESGCSFVAFDQEHQTYCEFRPTKCYSTGCTWEGCVKDLLEHVKGCQKHKNTMTTPLGVGVKRLYYFDKTRSNKFFSPIICESQVFWEFCHMNSVTKFISHKLYYVPTSKPTCIYYMVVSLKKNEIEFTHTCRASTDITNHSESVESGVIISDSYLELIGKEDNKYSYTFTLIRN